MNLIKKFGPYVLFLAVAVGLSCLVQRPEMNWLRELFEKGTGSLFLVLPLLVVVAYGLKRLAPCVAVPSYVWAIIFGMALQPLLYAPIMQDLSNLRVIVELLAAFILFASAIAIPMKNFRKFFTPIVALSLAGTILTVILFTYVLAGLVGLFDLQVSVVALLVLAAILASVDPSAITGTLDRLTFRRPFLRDVAVSEGAVNDVAGTILTRFFLIGALSVAAGSVAMDGSLAPLFARSILESFALELVWGTLVGLLGAKILSVWGASIRTVHWSDLALFLTIPIFTFALGSIVAGSGFLAAFVAGLMFNVQVGTEVVRASFTRVIDDFMKPVVFILLGILVPLDLLVTTAGVGIAAALIFMFVIRPAVVFTTLLPWMSSGTSILSWREALFLSFIRETGAIPAVLILIAFAVGLVDVGFVFAVGMWVILLTLTIEPPLTPLIARYLGVAKR